MTGFAADLGDECHLVLFREATDKKQAIYTLPREIDSAELIAANTSTEHTVSGKEITVTFGKKRSYVWLKVKLK